MEKLPGRINQPLRHAIVFAVLSCFFISCGEKETTSREAVEAPSDGSTARWLARREEMRKARESNAIDSPVQVQDLAAAAAPSTKTNSTPPAQPAGETSAPVSSQPESKGAFAQRLSAIVGSAITSDSELRKKAERGEAAAQRELGRSIAGTGDYAEAAQWYRKAADQGDAQAQHDLATLYVFGMGVSQDFAEAVKWFEASAQQGNVESQYSLGLRYLKGDHVQQDFTEAAKWFRMAAEQGNADSQLSLARRYVAGEGVAKDPVEAYKWASLSDANGKWGASDVVASIAATLSPEQLADAKGRVESFSAKK